jgi:hypothetical protein
VVRSAFGDLVFPCRTECPDGPIGKLKNGGIIGAVSVPNLASRQPALVLMRRGQGSHGKDSPTEADLYWRFKPAVLPACRFHRITYQHFVDVIAPRTFKGPQIGVGGTKFDAGQLHVALALGATWPFDGKQRRFGTSMKFRHVMHP